MNFKPTINVAVSDEGGSELHAVYSSVGTSSVIQMFNALYIVRSTLIAIGRRNPRFLVDDLSKIVDTSVLDIQETVSLLNVN